MISDLNAAIPLRSAQTEMQNTTAQRQQQQTQSHLETSVTLRAIRDRLDGKGATPETVAQASQLFSAAELPFTRKNTMFGANPNIQIVS